MGKFKGSMTISTNLLQKCKGAQEVLEDMDVVQLSVRVGVAWVQSGGGDVEPCRVELHSWCDASCIICSAMMVRAWRLWQRKAATRGAIG